MMQHIDFGLEVKALDEAGAFEGYASTFNNVDAGGDKVMPGAFADGLKSAQGGGRTVKMLWQHDQSQPIGVWDSISEDENGLFVRGRLVMEVPKAREAHALAKAGALGGLSIGYRTVKSEPEGNYRKLVKLDLFEISVVTMPMNDRARFTAIKADDVIEKLRAGVRLTEREFEALVKGLGLSNSQAERAARVHLKGPGEPAEADQHGVDFLSALLGRMA